MRRTRYQLFLIAMFATTSAAIGCRADASESSRSPESSHAAEAVAKSAEAVPRIARASALEPHWYNERSDLASPLVAARHFDFIYEVEVPAVPSGQSIDLFIPIAENGDHQRADHTLSSSIPGTLQREEVYGNLFWHGYVAKSDGKPISVRVDYDVRRAAIPPVRVDKNAAARATQTQAQKSQLALFSGANKKVPVSGDLIDRIRKDLPKSDGTTLGKARTIFNYVLANMEYKKSGTGWGNGDTYWACSEKYGNCTDFHALFISLARAEGIPARFEIGFPVPEDRPSGKIGGYHCWVNFYISGAGWIPVDASEAWKHPDKKSNLFAAQPADRIRFSVGRDLKLGKGHRSRPLNYFVYPLLEVNGRRSTDLKTQFRYADK